MGDSQEAARSAAWRLDRCGVNGSGKSTLLQVLAGRLALLAGVRVPGAYLDQTLSGLDAGRSVFEQLRGGNAWLADGEQRARLALRPSQPSAVGWSAAPWPRAAPA